MIGRAPIVWVIVLAVWAAYAAYALIGGKVSFGWVGTAERRWNPLGYWLMVGLYIAGLAIGIWAAWG